MKEFILKEYFLGRCGVESLVDDLANTVDESTSCVKRYKIEDIDQEFEVSSKHLLLLCDDFLNERIEARDLKAIGFALIASDNFNWDADTEDGERVAETVSDWSSPEINYPLTIEYMKRFKERLVTGSTTFSAIK